MTNCAADLRPVLALLAVASFFVPATADEKRQAPVPVGVTRVLDGVHPSGFGGGPIVPPTDFITDEQRETIWTELDASVERLRISGKLTPLAPDAHPLFGWPLRLAPGLYDPGYHGISNFVDLNPSVPNVLLDYNCGARTYDSSSGYNHAGTDFFTWPWAWRKMDRGEVQIVAAAPGQIIDRRTATSTVVAASTTTTGMRSMSGTQTARLRGMGT